ncbi:MAG: ParB/RepB/Spo0J family partition protein [Planctomycetota bacterium]|jgi:ParB-like chromosome segregation protein Spo0J
MKKKKLEIIKIEEMEFKVLYPDLLPKIKTDEYERLSNSIKEMGVLVPVLVDENKGIVDGAHRLRASTKDYPFPYSSRSD